MIPRPAARTTLALALAAGAVGILGTAASAGDGGCPGAAGWTRVADLPTGTTSVTVSAPAGAGIVETCVSTGTEAQVYAYDPAASTVVIAPVGVAADGASALEITEYAYRLIALEPVVEEPAPEPPPAASPEPVPAPAPAPAPAPQPSPSATTARPASQGSPAAPTNTAAPASSAPALEAPPVDTVDAPRAPVAPTVEVAAARASAVVRAPATLSDPGTGDGRTAGLVASLGALLLLGAGGSAVLAIGRRRPAAAATARGA